MKEADVKRLLAAAKFARKQIKATRRILIESHSNTPRSPKVENVTDPGALEWIEEHDVAIAKLDKAIAKFKKDML